MHEPNYLARAPSRLPMMVNGVQKGQPTVNSGMTGSRCDRAHLITGRSSDCADPNNLGRALRLAIEQFYFFAQ